MSAPYTPPPDGPDRPERPELDDIRPLGFRPGGRARPAPGRPGGMLPDRGRWRTLALLALILLIVGVALRKQPSACSLHPPSGPNPADASFWVASAVAGIPCPSTGRAIYGLRDSAGRPMVGLDPVADPRGGYLGVYETQAASGSAVALARSSDLTSWRRLRVLAAGGSGHPTLQPVPAGGYLLACEHRRHIELRFYPSLSALLAAREAASIDLPLQLSATQNGAPSFRSVAWNGRLRRSELSISFDYRSGGLERAGIGLIRGFRTWRAQPDPGLDRMLDARGLTGDHGQQRQFTVRGRTWTILEAQERSASERGGAGGWHIALEDSLRREAFALKLGTVKGILATSFGRPVARVLPAPSGPGQDLVVSLYVFGAGAARSEAGELLYWTPIGSS